MFWEGGGEDDVDVLEVRLLFVEAILSKTGENYNNMQKEWVKNKEKRSWNEEVRGTKAPFIYYEHV